MVPPKICQAFLPVKYLLISKKLLEPWLKPFKKVDCCGVHVGISGGLVIPKLCPSIYLKFIRNFAIGLEYS